MRALHERMLPAGALSGTDNFYRVDLEGGKLNEVMAELNRNLAGATPASGARTLELMARMDALIRADNDRMSKSLARVAKTNRAAILAVVIGLLIVLLVGTKVLG
jgi:hypothetical protein